jgi:hypothetical protein
VRLAEPNDGHPNNGRSIFWRSIPLLSKDRDNDGIVEIPTQRELDDSFIYNAALETEAPCYFTNWVDVGKDGNIVSVTENLLYFNAKQYIQIPEEFSSNITVRTFKNADPSVWHVLRQNERGEIGEELFWFRPIALEFDRIQLDYGSTSPEKPNLHFLANCKKEP